MCVELKDYIDNSFRLQFSEYSLAVSWADSELNVVLEIVNRVDLVEHHSCGKTTRYIRNTDLKYQPYEQVDEGYLLTTSENLFTKINEFNCFTFRTIYWSLYVICDDSFKLDTVFVIDNRTNDKLLNYTQREENTYV